MAAEGMQSALMDETPLNQDVQQPRGEGAATPNSRLNPTFKENPRQYLFYSRGVSQAKGQGLASLFREIGSAAENVVQGIDHFVENRVKAEVYEKGRNAQTDMSNMMMNQLYQKFTGLPGQLPAPAPDQVQKAIGEVANTKTAALQGAIPHIYYNMKLNSIAKDMRANYPGYRDVIDSEISKITGGDPANKQLTELFAANAHQAATKEDHETKLKWEMTKEIMDKVPGGARWYANERQRTGQDPSFQAVADKLNEWTGARSNEQRMEQQLRLKEIDGKVTDKDIADHAIYKANVARGRVMADTAFGDIQQVQKLTQDIVNSGQTSLSPQQNAQAVQLINKIRDSIKQSTAAVLKDPKFDHLPPAVREQIMKDDEQYVELLSSGLVGKEFKPGLVNMAANIANAMHSSDNLRVLNGSEAMRVWSVVNHNLGSQMGGVLMGFYQGRGALTDIKQDLDNVMATGLGKMVAGPNDTPGPVKLTEVVKKVGPQEAGRTGQLVDQLVKVITDPQSGKEGVKNLIENIYGDPNNFLTARNEKGQPLIPSREERDRLFTTLTSPAIVNKISELQKEGVLGRNAFNGMQDWVSMVVNQHMGADIQAVGRVNGDMSNRYIVGFNPTTNHFETIVNPDFHVQADKGGTSQSKGAVDRIADRLNTSIDPLIRINEATGSDPAGIQQKLQLFFQQNHLDLGIAKETSRTQRPAEDQPAANPAAQPKGIPSGGVEPERTVPTNRYMEPDEAMERNSVFHRAR